ncbi:hypothetical protein AVEN_42971-1 [Araneus ventricosus]|uniref:Uncharacterized protein n=1 Tax=Araneus ventricosus TaxID=182803 RepID=A0A4Y2AFV8_ARAVE|nr:hypothetical protein AVEN_42971-1 [Araneus ventricosus]
MYEIKRPPAVVVRKFGEGATPEVSSTSSDCDSELRGPSQNSSRVASKRFISLMQLVKDGRHVASSPRVAKVAATPLDSLPNAPYIAFIREVKLINKSTIQKDYAASGL